MRRRLAAARRAIVRLARSCVSSDFALNDTTHRPQRRHDFVRSSSPSPASDRPASLGPELAEDAAQLVPTRPPEMRPSSQSVRHYQPPPRRRHQQTSPRKRTRRARSCAHRLPWEILLAVCRQADEEMLVQLCLVSLGMLELAGPILYRKVEIAAIHRIRSFFLAPSTIHDKSRLRPFLGPALTQSLHVDYRSFDLELEAALLPPSAWDGYDRRVVTPLSVRHMQVTLPFDDQPFAHLQAQLANLVRPTTRMTKVYHLPRQEHLGPSVTLDAEFADISFLPPGSPGRQVTRLIGLELSTVAGPTVMFYLEQRVAKSRVTLDLRRVEVAGPPSSAIVLLRALVAACLVEEGFWKSPPGVELIFVVASDVVGRAVAIEIASSGWVDREKLCLIVKT